MLEVNGVISGITCFKASADPDLIVFRSSAKIRGRFNRHISSAGVPSMKVRILSLLTLAFLLAADASKEPEVPTWNRKVLAFARDNLDKKVGDGECATLAVRALEEAKA